MVYCCSSQAPFSWNRLRLPAGDGRHSLNLARLAVNESDFHVGIEVETPIDEGRYNLGPAVDSDYLIRSLSKGDFGRSGPPSRKTMGDASPFGRCLPIPGSVQAVLRCRRSVARDDGGSISLALPSTKVILLSG